MGGMKECERLTQNMMTFKRGLRMTSLSQNTGLTVDYDVDIYAAA
jgi:hypothetical protein